MKQLMGYERADGRYGIRNYVLVISLVQCANGTVTQIANACGVAPITIDTGCGDYEEAANKLNLGLISAGIHPNVYGVLLVSLGCQWISAEMIGDPIRAAGKRVEHICIQDEGGIRNSVAKGIRIVQQMQEEAAAQKRVPFPMSKLLISTNAGGSDWTSSISGNPCVGGCCDLAAADGASNLIGCVRGMPGSESTLCDVAATQEVGEHILEVVESYCQDLKEATGQSVSEVNPTPGNKAGGLTTLAEKAIGNLKLRGHSPIVGVLECGEQPTKPGGYVLNERHGGNDLYQTTSLSMSGSQIQLFTTGRGSPHGNAVLPVLKVTGNPHVGSYLSEFIDFCSGDVLTGERTLAQASQDLYDLVIEVCNGKQVRAEINGDFSYGTPPSGKF